jgi:hypothetical protein
MRTQPKLLCEAFIQSELLDPWIMGAQDLVDLLFRPSEVLEVFPCCLRRHDDGFRVRTSTDGWGIGNGSRLCLLYGRQQYYDREVLPAGLFNRVTEVYSCFEAPSQMRAPCHTPLIDSQSRFTNHSGGQTEVAAFTRTVSLVTSHGTFENGTSSADDGLAGQQPGVGVGAT